MPDSGIIHQYIDVNRSRFIKELIDLLRIPSISTLSDHAGQITRCADLVKMLLIRSGCTGAEILETGGNPVVYGELISDPARPTILVYGHYDVVPADPVDLWGTEPFDPVIRKGRIYARGASDDKGQFFIHLKAMETLIGTKSIGSNFKFLIEGEEEIGSAHLKSFLKKHRHLVRADVALISDGMMPGRNMPSLETGFRGFCALDLEILGANRELHSGLYGGAIINPVSVLSEILASLHDHKYRIRIPGFYDNVRNPTVEEGRFQEKVIIDEEEYARKIGVKELWGEEGFNLTERTSLRPTVEIIGIRSGYTGNGIKSIIPSRAQATISSRLVPDQSSAEVLNKMCSYIKSITPSMVDLKMVCHPACEPYTVEVGNPYFQLAFRALADVFKIPPVFRRDGGSLPLCAWIESELGIKSILMGFGLQEDNIHGPNESLELLGLERGIETIVKFHEYLGSDFPVSTMQHK